MNKMKLLLDVAKAMKEKETLKGALTAEGVKDGVTVLKFGNDFEVTDRVKAKISAEVNDGDRVLKHESSTEFSLPCGGPGGRRHHFHHGMHGYCRPGGPRGIKGVFERLSLALTILSNVHMEEQEDKTVLLTFDSDTLPADIKDAISQRIKERHLHGMHGFPREGGPCGPRFHNERRFHGDPRLHGDRQVHGERGFHGGPRFHGEHGCHGPLGLVHGLLPYEQGRVRCKALINDAKEIIMLSIDVEGKRQAEGETRQDVHLTSQVRFIW
ncbi:hypothetical protein GTO91_10465 [Heliobacterium undosum]|uniref:Uncharacterized protein n=1 Tax=Heliomicrobium undosum TaxID=121734 RepID=A0A845L634_9FIRM|nr:hypothetical protein [Heliomicrobium undosum]MZP30130.1 hypothetical protein [Heliomicrobium undosum]